MPTLGAEEHDIRLEDVVVGKHDVDRRRHGKAAVCGRMVTQQIGDQMLTDLMPGERGRDDDHLAIVELVPAAAVPMRS